MTSVSNMPPVRVGSAARAPASPVLWQVPDQASSESAEFDVAIVGLGYVGLPTALAYHNAGSRVLAFDVSDRRIRDIRSNRADLIASDRARLRSALVDQGFTLTSRARDLARAGAVVVCVPTPVDEHLIPDLSALRRACATVVERAVPGQLLILTSTTYVGCTEDLLVTPLRERGLNVGEDVFVAFSAERIDPGNQLVAQEDVPRVVGASTPKCEERAYRLLRRYAQRVHRVGSLGAAEMTKLIENTFRAVNIALANEFADICRVLGIDVTDVIEAASTKPYGFMAFMPGAGVGGHCIPCDPHYLLWQLRKNRVEAPVIAEAMSQIAARPGRLVERIRQTLSDAGRGLRGARVLVIGVSYKPDVSDLRESPALEIMASLQHAGADVGYADPRVRLLSLADGTVLESVERPEEFEADVILVHTRHTGTDLSWVSTNQIVIDATYTSNDVPRRVLP
ncbi:nucleotide sugar dehydrogenase [Ruicaihuangia caeni]|uniref:nucleotide sugar dehydrogenase n=1 Tax=Ruicaihuangia caeni TaxID=3042517 RepID=UPI00338F1B09